MANVSTGTVDRVIHNRPGVSAKTKEKIQALLDEHDFERNLLASTLAFKKRYSIATLIPKTDSKKNFWYEPKKGIKAAYKEIKKFGAEVHMFYFDQFDVDSYKESLEKIIKFKPNGVVLAPFFYKTSLSFTEKLKAENIPYLFINIDLESPYKLTFIGEDSYLSGYLCGKMLNLVSLPEEHLGIILSRRIIDNHRAIEDRAKGFFKYINDYAKNRVVKQIYVDSFSDKEVRKVLTNEFIEDNSIKGLYVPSSSAHAVAKFLDSVQIRDRHIVGFDAHLNNLDWLKKGTLDFVIDQNPFEQGYMGVKVLFDYLAFNRLPKVKYNSPIKIVTKENADFFKEAVIEEYAE
jgi:LacI family transcriptional regulator